MYQDRRWGKNRDDEGRGGVEKDRKRVGRGGRRREWVVGGKDPRIQGQSLGQPSSVDESVRGIDLGGRGFEK